MILSLHNIAFYEKMMLDIVNQSNEQKDKNTSVQNSISNLTQIGENNSVAAEEISASMIELSNIANNTKNKVSEFKLDNEIEIKNVSFKYPATEKMILKNTKIMKIFQI